MNILLDTNVLSELLRARPDALVSSWFDAQPQDTLLVSAITEAEMLLGVELLPAGKRRTQLRAGVEGMFREDFTGRVLPFDETAAAMYAPIVAARRRAGRPISQFDAQIVAIAVSRQVGLATRNIADFSGCGVALCNPWDPVD